MSNQGTDGVSAEDDGTRKVEEKAESLQKQDKNKKIIKGEVDTMLESNQGHRDSVKAEKNDGPSTTIPTEVRNLEFANEDYKLVHREIMDIKSCRTNIFMGTLGVLGAVGVAILGIRGTKLGTSWRTWLPLASLIPVGLLISAILATIHKARGINERAGYLEALAEYLANGVVPDYFCGWPKAKELFKRCKIYLQLGTNLRINKKCKLGQIANEKLAECKLYQTAKEKMEEENKKNVESEQTKSKDLKAKKRGRFHSVFLHIKKSFFAYFFSRKKYKPYCFREAKPKANVITNHLTTFTYPLHSFTSLSTYVFGVCLIISIGTLLLTIMTTVENHIPIEFSRKVYFCIVMILAILTVILAFVSTKSKYWFKKNASEDIAITESESNPKRTV